MVKLVYSLKSILVILLPENAYPPILVIEFGNVIFVKFLHSAKATLSIVFKFVQLFKLIVTQIL